LVAEYAGRFRKIKNWIWVLTWVIAMVNLRFIYRLARNFKLKK
jgi:hypothetical protein